VSIPNLAPRPHVVLATHYSAASRRSTRSSTAKFAEGRADRVSEPDILSPPGLSNTSLSIRETSQKSLRANMHDKHEMTRTAHWDSAIGTPI
jgi:hypothetical protein